MAVKMLFRPEGPYMTFLAVTGRSPSANGAGAPASFRLPQIPARLVLALSESLGYGSQHEADILPPGWLNLPVRLNAQRQPCQTRIFAHLRAPRPRRIAGRMAQPKDDSTPFAPPPPVACDIARDPVFLFLPQRRCTSLQRDAKHAAALFRPWAAGGEGAPV